MKIDLTGKRALVSASTAGIGYVIAKGLANCGAEVLINGRNNIRVNDAVSLQRLPVQPYVLMVALSMTLCNSSIQ